MSTKDGGTKKIFITGATGFVGRHLIKRLLLLDVEVTAVYRRKNNIPDFGKEHNRKIRWIPADIVRDDLSRQMKDADYIFHLAAELSKKELFYKTNVYATRILAEAAIKAGVKKFVYMSSIAAGEHASGNTTIIDESNGYPISLYGKSKRLGEKAVVCVADTKIDYLIFRPTALFGQYHKGSFFEFVKVVKQKKYIQIGNGKNPINFLYIDDFINYVIEISFSPIKNTIFIVNHRKTTLKVFTNFVHAKLKLKPRPFYIPLFVGMLMGAAAEMISKFLTTKIPISRQRVKAICRPVYYNNRKIQETGIYVSEAGLEEGVNRTISWYQKESWI